MIMIIYTIYVFYHPELSGPWPRPKADNLHERLEPALPKEVPAHVDRCALRSRDANAAAPDSESLPSAGLACHHASGLACGVPTLP